MTNDIRIAAGAPWYDLFSRGARDWLRHNEKVREGVQQALPEIIAGPDIITGSQERVVHVPVHLLEHARFRLSDSPSRSQVDAGQGNGRPGDVLHPVQSDKNDATGQGDNSNGEVKLMMELNVDDIIDWLWEEMKLPDLKPKSNSSIDDQEFVREGWDKRGARARLDRRRTVKEAVKRRAIQENAVPFSDEDLRFRQLVQRRKPATRAVVIFVLDVSASMTDAERKLAKSFFFFALQGLRRTYNKVETRFIAHTTQAWEFSERDFFQVTGTGGTGASTAFELALDLIHTQFDPSQYNGYLFYASDGENFAEDRVPSIDSLLKLTSLLNFIGYVETVPGTPRTTETEMHMICGEFERKGAAIGTSVLTRPDDVWQAIRKFFGRQTEHGEAA